MVDAAAIQANIDASFTALVGTIAARQASYYAGHGRYFQGLWSHSVAPVDGAQMAPDLLASRPGYQAESWADVAGDVIPTSTQARFVCNQYRGPQGDGFEFVLECLLNGQLWQKTVNFGPESYRDRPWTVVS